MVYAQLIRAGLCLIGGSLLLKIAISKWSSKNVDIQQIFDSAEEELAEFLSDLEKAGVKISEQVESFLEQFKDLNIDDEEQDVDLSGYIQECETWYKMYSALPDVARDVLDECIDVKATLNEALRSAYSAHGWSLIGEMNVADLSLEQHLERQYLGLYHIGRAGERLDNQSLEPLVADLRHFHSQLDRDVDQPLVNWYQTIGVTSKVPLDRLLGATPEIYGLECDHRYIAYALGQDIELDFDNLFESRV